MRRESIACIAINAVLRVTWSITVTWRGRARTESDTNCSPCVQSQTRSGIHTHTLTHTHTHIHTHTHTRREAARATTAKTRDERGACLGYSFFGFRFCLQSGLFFSFFADFHHLKWRGKFYFCVMNIHALINSKNRNIFLIYKYSVY